MKPLRRDAETGKMRRRNETRNFTGNIEPALKYPSAQNLSDFVCVDFFSLFQTSEAQASSSTLDRSPTPATFDINSSEFLFDIRNPSSMPTTSDITNSLPKFLCSQLLKFSFWNASRPPLKFAFDTSTQAPSNLND